MKTDDISQPLTFFGYTIEQIRQMDVWFQKQNLSWQILDEKYKQGFEAGVKADRQIIQENLDKLCKQVKTGPSDSDFKNNRW